VEPAKEADIPALSLQARSVGLSPSSPAASPALLAFDYQPIPKGYRLPARSPSRRSFRLPRSPWSSPPSSSRPPATEAQATVNTVQQSGRVARGLGRWVKRSANLPGMEEDVDTFADAVIDVDDDIPASDFTPAPEFMPASTFAPAPVSAPAPTTAPAATQSSSETAIAKRTKEQQLWDRDTILSDKTYPGSGRYREPCH
jgi:hypothetical protein